MVLQDPYQSLHPGIRVEHALGEPVAIAGETEQVIGDPRHPYTQTLLAASESVR